MKKRLILGIILPIIVINITAIAETSEFSYDDFIDKSSQYEMGDINLRTDSDNPEKLSKKAVKQIISSVSIDIKNYVNSLLIVSVILIIAAMLSVFLSDKDNSNVGLYGIYILCAIILSKELFSVSKVCIDAIDDLFEYMNMSFSGYTVLLASSGYGVTSNYMQSIFLLISETASFIISKITIPILYSCAIIGVANGITQSEDISLIIKSTLKFIKYTLGIILTVISAIMGFTGFSAISTDGIAVKTAKYAVSNFVPIVGSCLADTLNNVVYTSVIMKNTVGYIGFITILMICLAPILKIYAMSFMIKIISLTASVLRHRKIVELADILSSVTLGFGALLAIMSIVFIIMIGIIMSLGG